MKLVILHASEPRTARHVAILRPADNPSGYEWTYVCEHDDAARFHRWIECPHPEYVTDLSVLGVEVFVRAVNDGVGLDVQALPGMPRRSVAWKFEDDAAPIIRADMLKPLLVAMSRPKEAA